MRSIHSTCRISGEKNKTYWNILLQRNQVIGRILEPDFKVSNSQKLRQTVFLSSAAPSKLSHTNRGLTLNIYFFLPGKHKKRYKRQNLPWILQGQNALVVFCFALVFFLGVGVDWLVGWVFWCCFFIYLFFYLTRHLFLVQQLTYYPTTWTPLFTS